MMATITGTIVLPTMTVEIAKYRGREYVSLDDLRLWFTRGALDNTDPIVKQTLTMIADELSKK